jgi:hypothetical protein
MASIIPPNNFIKNNGIDLPSNPLSNIKKPNLKLPDFKLPDFKNKIVSTNINDNTNTKLTAYWNKGTDGYPIFYAEAFKTYGNDENSTSFISLDIPTYIEQTNEQVKSIVSRTFWELAQQIHSADIFNGVIPPFTNDNGEPLPTSAPPQYSVADFILDPPKNVPWQQPILTPEEKEKERLALKEKALQAKKDAQDKVPNWEELKGAIPKDLLAKGKEALPGIIYTLGYTVLQTQIIPSLQKLVIEYLEKYLEDGIQSCPPELQILIDIRNKIVNQLNRLAKKIEQIGRAITGFSTFLSTIITTITTIDIASIIVSAATKIIPPGIPIPGQITSALNDAQTFIRKATFDKFGNSKLSAIKAIIASSALILSLIGGWILQAIDILARLDVLIMNCNPNATLTPISDDVKLLGSLNLQAQNTQNNTTYQGFILDIVEIPYTPTVNRYQAVGKNAQGIILIKGDLSFTSSSQTLINELKLIIDRDNLQAY